MFGRDEKVSAIRLTAAQYLILAIFLVLAYGLWRLQVMQTNLYATLAQKNNIRNVPILAPRGKILDREGRIIVDNYPSFSALLLRDSSRDLNADADLIAEGLHLDANEVRTRIRHFASMPQYQPIFLKEDITQDEQAFVEAHRNELPELDTIRADRRLYPRNGFMAHLIGYVGEVTEDMLNQPQFELYNPGDVVGVSGVERQYNDALMGTNGARRELVNSHGREVGLLGETDAIPGKQLKLTVDIDLQIAAEEALEGKNGAIVAMDPHTGEILAMASRPTFDPNDFAVRVSRDEWNKLVTDPDKPLLNKAIQAQLAPGSTFNAIKITGKGQKQRAVLFPVRLLRSIERYRHMERSRRVGSNGEKPGSVFVGRAGKPLRTSAINRVFSTNCKRAGLHIWPHLLRHRLSVERLGYLQDIGGPNPLKVVQMELGHAHMATTERYLHLT